MWRRPIIRRTILIGCAVAVIVLLATNGLGLVREMRARGQMRELQRQCMTHMAAVDQVVYDDNPQVHDALLRSDAELAAGQFVDQPDPRPHLARRYEAWQRFVNVQKGLYSTPVFLHGRRCGIGAERLTVVAIRTRDENVACPTIQLDSAALAPITAWGYPDVNARHHRLTFSGMTNDVPVRFYAGQPDPQDGTRFTIAFQCGNAPGMIEGYVLDDGMIRLRVIDGPGEISN